MKNTKFSLLSSALSWNHGVYGLASFWTLLLYGFQRKKWAATFIIAVALSAPVIVISLLYSQGALATWSGHTETWQEWMIFNNPLGFLPIYAGGTLAGFLFLGIVIYRWKSASEFEKTLVLSLLGMTVLIPLVADRFLQYATIPLSCIAAIGICKNKGRLLAFSPFLIMVFVIYQVNFWWINLTGNWWTP